MCHQSVGLIQAAVERAGVTTVSVTLRPEITWGVRVPRAAYVRFPLGNPLGEGGRPDHQERMLRDLLGIAEAATEPETIVELPYRWRRMDRHL